MYKLCLLLILLSTVLYAKENSTIADTKQSGVCWVAGRQVTEAQVASLTRSHVKWISQTPFGWQSSYNSPTVATVTDGRILWGERDEGLENTTQLAKKLGIKTLLKPHIWLHQRNDGKWRADIAMNNDPDWQSWFGSYKKFILHYAKLAEKNSIEVLSIGTELRSTIKTKPEVWRQIIAEVRKVYHGKLTYSANWYKEFEEVEFWDDLDFIGIQGYFPLSQKENPSVKELKKGWRSHLKDIERIQKKFQKPILFTEIGYKSTANPAAKPWEWMRSSKAPSATDLQTQANCYEAFFQVFWEKEWFAGVYFWKWFPEIRKGSRRGQDRFTFQGHPAEKTMADWYDTNLTRTGPKSQTIK